MYILVILLVVNQPKNVLPSLTGVPDNNLRDGDFSKKAKCERYFALPPNDKSNIRVKEMTNLKRKGN